MLHIKIESFIQNLSKLLNYVIKNQKSLKIHAPIGNVVLLSLEQYNNLIHTLNVKK